MVNLEIREFSQSIVNFVNQSSLPVEIKRLCITEIATQIQSAADEQIRAEILKRDETPTTEQEGKNELIKGTSEDTVEE